MNIKIVDKSIFKTYLNHISRGIISTSPLKSLQGILMEATNENLTLTVSDGHLSFKEIINHNDGILINKPGKVLVSGRLFKDIVDKIDEKFIIKTTTNKMTITSELTKIAINLFNVEDYSEISFETFGKDLVINAKDWKKVIRNVFFAADFANKDMILNCINIKVKDQKIIFTATNSFRLAQEIIPIKSDIDFEVNVLAKRIRDFLPAETKPEIILNIDDNKIISKIGQTTISSRIIENIYPDVAKIIPTEFTTEIIIDVIELEKNIDRVVLVSDRLNLNRPIKLIFNEKEELKFEVENEEIGNSVSSSKNYVVVKEVNKPVEIVFNYFYLKEAISKFQGKIKLGFNGDLKPFIITGLSNLNLTQLIMPQLTLIKKDIKDE